MGTMNKEESTRLDRIEEKIDKLSDAIISIARAEEKIHNIQINQQDVIIKLRDIDNRIRLLETQTLENEKKLSALTKFFWIVVTGVVTTVTGSIAMFNAK